LSHVNILPQFSQIPLTKSVKRMTAGTGFDTTT
jgi:hypothetical protein